jgi:hypothetical protein
MSKASQPASPLEALKAGFRRACVKRLVGDEAGAVAVLRDEIPNLVVGWAKSTPLDAAQKKAKLKELFDDESGRANELAVAFDLFAGRFESRVAEVVQNEVSGLANGIESLINGLNSTLNRVGEMAKKLSALETPGVPHENFEIPLQDSSNVKNISVTELEEPQAKTIDEESSGDQLEELNSSADGMPFIDKEEDIEVLPAKIIKRECTDDLKKLDPPSGTGLRFDEIEEMIDEILSYDSK